jgi:hypothetical protein
MCVYIIERSLRLNFNLIIWTKLDKISKIKNDILCNVLNEVEPQSVINPSPTTQHYF